MLCHKSQGKKECLRKESKVHRAEYFWEVKWDEDCKEFSNMRVAGDLSKSCFGQGMEMEVTLEWDEVSVGFAMRRKRQRKGIDVNWIREQSFLFIF